MSSYGVFAKYYDQLTENISYKDRVNYFQMLIEKYGNGGKELVDLACGTGNMSTLFSELGYHVIGIDQSQEMLTEAMQKNPGDILYLQQRMEQLDLYGKTDIIICALDSLNHVTDIKMFQMIFERIELFLEDDGIFIFDMNTPFKHEKILKNEVFIYDLEEVCCIWKNSWNEKNRETEISLDFFVHRKNNLYERFEEVFYERSYSSKEVLDTIEGTGLKVEAIFEADTFNPPKEDTERWIYIVRKR